MGDLTALFDACVRIGREAECPIVIENVRGAQPWIGQARWMYGSFALFGDVPALMPPPRRATGVKTQGHPNIRDGHPHTRHLTNPAEHDGEKQVGIKRKAASAMIAKIPLPLSQHIARCYLP